MPYSSELAIARLCCKPPEIDPAIQVEVETAIRHECKMVALPQMRPQTRPFQPERHFVNHRYLQAYPPAFSESAGERLRKWMRLAPYKALHFDSLYGQIKSREPIESEYGFHLIVNIRRGFAEKVDCPNATIISPTIVRNSSGSVTRMSSAHPASVRKRVRHE